MELNVEKFKKIIVEKMFKNNQRQCAIALEISPVFLNKILKNKTNAGAMFLGKLKKFCNINNINFDDFIFLK